MEKYISFDLGMLSKFHYYTGIIVKAYTYGVGDAIVKGGRYDALLTQFGKEAPAIGCVFLLDDIMSALNAQKIAPDVQENTAWYVYDEVNQKDAMKEIADRRKKGLPTVAIPYQKDRSQEDYQRYAAKHSVKEVHFYISLEK